MNLLHFLVVLERGHYESGQRYGLMVSKGYSKYGTCYETYHDSASRLATDLTLDTRKDVLPYYPRFSSFVQRIRSKLDLRGISSIVG